MYSVNDLFDYLCGWYPSSHGLFASPWSVPLCPSVNVVHIENPPVSILEEKKKEKEEDNLVEEELKQDGRIKLTILCSHPLGNGCSSSSISPSTDVQSADVTNRTEFYKQRYGMN